MSTDPVERDVETIGRIAAVPTILEVVCRTTGMGFAAVARVTEDRWVACSVRDDIAFGLKAGGELQLDTTICNEIKASRQAVIINHVAEDKVFAAHRTPALYGFQSYISMPIMLGDDTFFGTLCAIDPRPHRLDTPEVVGMFKLFAELIAFHLDAHRQIAVSQALLLDAQQASDLREEFIAVLGHDLRNPLAGIDAAAHMLLRKGGVNERGKVALAHIRKSVDRMAELIGNVLDFARGRLGSGLALERRADASLQPLLEQVIQELRVAAPGRVIEVAIAIPHLVRCDPNRVGQLLSNLVGNAITHGAVDEPIRVSVSTDASTFELTVRNGGKPIPEATLQDLFKPFFRASSRSSAQGLGLGLYIASEIAKAHDGQLEVESSRLETSFVFRMPRDATDAKPAGAGDAQPVRHEAQAAE